MPVTIDKETCIGCGICEGLYPELFIMNDEGKAEVTDLKDYDPDNAAQAIEQCPVSAISGE